jgi:hypothetical protein
MTLSPSGRLLLAAFCDGTIRIFDLTGTFNTPQQPRAAKSNHGSSNNSSLEDGLFDMDSSSEDEQELSNFFEYHNDSAHEASPKRGARSRYVLSKEYQRYGAVASQVHAKGVITSLIMDVDIAQDGQYLFAGALRGAQDMIAVHLGGIEAYLDKRLSQPQPSHETPPDLLDLITVYRCSDAKLRGFGACTRLRNGSRRKQYLLFTGKAIKNIHIWKFEPPLDPKLHSAEGDGKWVQLYDTQTNGNTIKSLQFRHDPNGLLQGISKSDDQKLRVWDLSYEQHQGDPKNPFFHKASVIQEFAAKQRKKTPSGRPKRPPFCDAASSETAAFVCGGFAICLCQSYNQISMVKLDVPDISSPYNHTELALPSTQGAVPSRRQQRGELKTIISVAGMAMDPSYVLLEVSDGSIIQYSDGCGQPKVEPVSLSGGVLWQEGLSRKLSVARVGSNGVVVAALSCYNSSSSRGDIVLRALNEEALSEQQRQIGFWGFSRFPKSQKKKSLTAAETGASTDSSRATSYSPSPRLHKAKTSCTSNSFSSTPPPATSQRVTQTACSMAAAKDTPLPPIHQESPHTDISPHPTANISQWTNPPSLAKATPSHCLLSQGGVQLFGTAGTDIAKLMPLECTHNPAETSQTLQALVEVSSTKASSIGATVAQAMPQQTPKKVPKLTHMIFSSSQTPSTTLSKGAAEPAPLKRKVAAFTGVPESCEKAKLRKPPFKKQRTDKANTAVSKPKPNESKGMRVSPEQPLNAPTIAPKKHEHDRTHSLDDLAAAALQLQSMKENNVNASSFIPISTPQLTRPFEKESPESHHPAMTLAGKAVDRIPETPTVESRLATACQIVSTIGKGGVKKVSPDSKTPFRQNVSAVIVLEAGVNGTVEKLAEQAISLMHSRPCSTVTTILTKTSNEAAHQLDTKTATIEGVMGSRANSSKTKRLYADTSTCSSGSKGVELHRSKVGKLASASDVGVASTSIQGSKIQRIIEVKNTTKKPPKISMKGSLANHGALLEQCVEQLVRLDLICSYHIPKTTVEHRMGLADALPSSNLTDRATAQELARMKLAAKHRAQHEKCLKQIIEAARFAVHEFRNAKCLGAIDEAEATYQESIKELYDILMNSVLFFQEEEASTLADQQRWENLRLGVLRTPKLQVSFPFFSVFDEVLACVDAVLKTVR